MKDRILRFSSMLLVLWYCFSIIGFDVHTCNASGRSFIATVLSGMACEDIHPSHHCNELHCCAAHSSCCSHEDSNHGENPENLSYRPVSCCSDDYLVLSVTGDTDQSQRGADAENQIFPVLLPVSVCGTPGLSGIRADAVLYEDPGPVILRAVRPLLNVWRI